MSDDSDHMTFDEAEGRRVVAVAAGGVMLVGFLLVVVPLLVKLWRWAF